MVAAPTPRGRVVTVNVGAGRIRHVQVAVGIETQSVGTHAAAQKRVRRRLPVQPGGIPEKLDLALNVIADRNPLTIRAVTDAIGNLQGVLRGLPKIGHPAAHGWCRDCNWRSSRSTARTNAAAHARAHRGHRVEVELYQVLSYVKEGD